MKKIMTCIDFTEGTDRIIEKSVELAAAARAELCLIHVVPPKQETAESVCGKRSFPELARRLCKCNRNFDMIAERIKKAGISFTGIRMRGEAGQIIADEALKNQIDLIIMGAKNNSALHHLMAGSIAAEVIRKTAIPVTLIPPVKAA